MITIQIDNDENSVDDQITYLRSVIDWLERGFTSGTNWNITGTDEKEDSEDDLPDSPESDLPF